MNRLSSALLISALFLGGCGGGSSAPTPSAAVVQPSRFAVPADLHQAAPPAPPSKTPAKPADVPRTAVVPAPPSAGAGTPQSVRRASSTSNPIVRFSTTLGNIDVELRPDAAPKNVANFMAYVNSGAYTKSVIHRSVPGFVFQGGGYTVNSGNFNAIPAQPPVVNEVNLSNIRGTLAMARLANNPNSATSQWFFNTVNNAASLDSQSGGYTVIGSVTSSSGLAVMDAIAAVPVPNPGPLASPFDQIPLINYTQGAAVQESNLIEVSSVTSQAAHPAFFAGEQSVGNGVYYLSFPNTNYFGYYSYLSDPRYIYHFDLGYEYVADANDGHSGIYLYDFASNTWFYTSPSYPFPYLYDFTLGSVLYYYPDATNAGRYSSNPRYFYEFKTGTVITK